MTEPTAVDLSAFNSIKRAMDTYNSIYITHVGWTLKGLKTYVTLKSYVGVGFPIKGKSTMTIFLFFEEVGSALQIGITWI